MSGVPVNGNSVYFNGSTDYISAPASANWDFDNGAFTIECWINPISVGTQQVIAFHGWSGSGAFNYGWNMQLNTSSQVAFYANGTLTAFTDLTISANQWTHLAFIGTGGVLSAFKNGTKSSITYTYTSMVARPTMTLVIGGWNNNTESIAERLWYGGYVSNFRVIKGQALYTANFTPATSSLSTTSQGALPGTVSLLTCQATTFTDSVTGATLTTAGAPKIIRSQSPFGYSPSLLTCQPTRANIIVDNGVDNNSITNVGSVRGSFTVSPFGNSQGQQQ
jgi:hypothetical protein